MASYSEVRAKHATLSGTTVDDVTITGYSKVHVKNRAADGGADLSVTWGPSGSTPTAPTALGDDTEHASPGEYVAIEAEGLGHAVGIVVKIIGNGNAYSVIGKP